MTRIVHHGHGIYCQLCQEVYDDTDGCDHRFDVKTGVSKYKDAYIAKPADMNHFSPHNFMEVDGLPTCSECGGVKLPVEMVESRGEPA